MKLRRFQRSCIHSFSMPWSPPSQLPLSRTRSRISVNLSRPGVRTMKPELNMSGHPTSGTALNSCGREKRWDRGRIGRTSASRKMILSNAVRRKTWSFVRTRLRSGRPVKCARVLAGVQRDVTRIKVMRRVGCRFESGLGALQTYREDPGPSSYLRGLHPRRPRCRKP